MFATISFIEAFFAEYRNLKQVKGGNLVLAQIRDVLKNVSSLSPEINTSVTDLLSFEREKEIHNYRANYLGIFFLALLVIVHSL